jgi:hypothetical protein
MAKNKSSTGETENGRIPKKVAATPKPPPNGDTPVLQPPMGATPSPAARTNPSSLAAAIVSPSPTSTTIWEQVASLPGPSSADPPTVENNEDVEGDDAAALTFLSGIGLRPRTADEPINEIDAKPAAAMARRSSRDAFIKLIVLQLHNGICLILFRLLATGFKNFPDFKMFHLHELYKMFLLSRQPNSAVTMPEVDRTTLRILRRMVSSRVDTSYYLWHVNNRPQLAPGTTYATRLYGMQWPEMVNREQAIGLAKFICEYLNEYRVPRTENSPEEPRTEAMAYIQNPADPSTLFWIDYGTDIVCTDVMSASNALDLFRRHLNLPLDEHTFENHEDVVAKYFRAGTMNYSSAKAIGAPYHMMSEEGQCEWRQRTGKPAPV